MHILLDLAIEPFPNLSMTSVLADFVPPPPAPPLPPPANPPPDNPPPAAFSPPPTGLGFGGDYVLGKITRTKFDFGGSNLGASQQCVSRLSTTNANGDPIVGAADCTSSSGPSYEQIRYYFTTHALQFDDGGSPSRCVDTATGSAASIDEAAILAARPCDPSRQSQQFTWDSQTLKLRGSNYWIADGTGGPDAFHPYYRLTSNRGQAAFFNNVIRDLQSGNTCEWPPSQQDWPAGNFEVETHFRVSVFYPSSPKTVFPTIADTAFWASGPMDVLKAILNMHLESLMIKIIRVVL
jgi:hypothetical protein